MNRNKLMLLVAIPLVSLLFSGFNQKNHQNERSQGKPNILLCIADDASFPHMSAYGYSWINTPGFDRVAEQGILFTNAYTPNAKCAPSRATILTGRNSWQLEEAANHWCYFPNKFRTYVETLDKAGYFVGFTGKGWAPGVVGNIDGKRRQLTGKPYQKQKTTPPTRAISNTDYAANFKEFLNDREDKESPFCFWYGAREPHRGYEFQSGQKLGNKKLSDIDQVFPFWPDNDTVRNDMLDYAFEIEYFDSHVQKMLDILEEKGVLHNTLIVVTSDHGMPFPRLKGQAYENSNHVPLAIMWPDGIKHTGRVIDDFISFIDLAPTFLELAGVDKQDNMMQPIEGTSMTDMLYSDKSGMTGLHRDHVLIGKERHDIGRPNDAGYPIRGIVTHEYLYLHNFKTSRWPAGNPETGYLNCDGSPTKTVCLDRRCDEGGHKYWKWSFGKRPREELYFLKDDPACINNLAEKDNYKVITNNLKEQLFQELKAQDDPRMFGKGDVFDDYPYANTPQRNYHSKYLNGEVSKGGWVNPTDYREMKPCDKNH